MLTTSCVNGAPKQSKCSIPALDRHVVFLGAATPLRASIVARLFGSFMLLPRVIAQGPRTRRRVPCLPPARPPHHGLVPGVGKPIRLLALGESTVCGVGLASGDESVAATTARALARLTGRPIAWRAEGLSGATVSDARERLLPRIAPEPADPLLVAFGLNDATAYRSPAAFPASPTMSTGASASTTLRSLIHISDPTRH